MARVGTRMSLSRPMALCRGLIRGDLFGYSSGFAWSHEDESSSRSWFSSGPWTSSLLIGLIQDSFCSVHPIL